MENKIVLDKGEVLRYLGYSGQRIEKELDQEIDNCIDEALKLFTPRWTYREFKILRVNGEIILEGTNLKLEGNDIRKLLWNSNKCVLMAVTLGNDIEKRIKLYTRTNLTKSVIMDACATAGVEKLCDNVEEEIIRDILKKEENLTFRYSPGYGDLSLNIQKDFISILDCKRKIGLGLSSYMILVPRKSVTAILGITKFKEKLKKSCINCSNYETCIYRKEDGDCGYKKKN